MRVTTLVLGLAVAFATCDFDPSEPQTCEACTAKGPRCTFCGDGSCRAQGTFEFITGNKCCTPEQPCFSSKSNNCPSLQLQCLGSRAYGWASAPPLGVTITITPSQETGEYATLSDCEVGRKYTAISAVNTDFITVRSGTYDGPVVAAGVTPVEFAAQTATTYLHYHLNSLCDGQSGGPYRLSSVFAPVGCTGTSPYGSAAAPDGKGEVTITTVQDPGEYATLSNIRAGVHYAVRVDGNDRYITIRYGTPNGPFVAAGMSPVEWLANQSAPFYAHFHVTAGCSLTPSGSRTSYLSNNRGECTATNSYGSVAAPAGGQTVEITSKQTVGEYSTITNAGYHAPLRVTSTVSSDYVTVRVASPSGSVVAAGTQPLEFTAGFAPSSYYLHFHSSRLCDALDQNYRTSRISNLRKECLATLAYGNVAAPQPGQTVTITTKQLTNEYAQVTGAVADRAYSFASSRQGDFLTIRMGSANGPTLASGISPVQYLVDRDAAGTLFVHFFAGDDCEVDDIERVSTVTAEEEGCLATSPWGSVVAPPAGETRIIDSGMFAGEYGTVTSATVNNIYSASSERTTDYITVRSGTPDGIVLRTGTGTTQPFAAQHSTFYVHVHSDNDCRTDSSYRSVSVTGHGGETEGPWVRVAAMFVKTSLHLQKQATIHPMKASAAGVLGAIAILGLIQSRVARKHAAPSSSESDSQSALV